MDYPILSPQIQKVSPINKPNKSIRSNMKSTQFHQVQLPSIRRWISASCSVRETSCSSLEAATFSWGQPSLPEKKWAELAELGRTGFVWKTSLVGKVGNNHPIHHIVPYIGNNHPNIWKKCSKPPTRYFSASDPSDWHRATSKMLLTNADRTSWKDLFFAVALDDIGEPPLDVFKLQIFQRTHTETKDTSAYCLKSLIFFYPGNWWITQLQSYPSTSWIKNLSATSGRSWSVFSSNRYSTPRKRYMFDILRLSCDSRWIARLQILQLWQWVLTELQVQDVATESDPPSSWANDWLFMIVTLLRDASDNDWHNIQHRLNVHQTWGCRSLTMDLRDYGGGTAAPSTATSLTSLSHANAHRQLETSHHVAAICSF